MRQKPHITMARFVIRRHRFAALSCATIATNHFTNSKSVDFDALDQMRKKTTLEDLQICGTFLYQAFA